MLIKTLFLLILFYLQVNFHSACAYGKEEESVPKGHPMLWSFIAGVPAF